MARYAFDPWGSRTITAGTDITSVGYTGYRWQSSGSGWLAQYRFLDPTLGRWASEDPLGLEDSPNLYAYVSNNPLSSRDADGRAAAAAAAGIGLCTAATAGACGAAAAAATVATAVVLCLASSDCRKEVGCFAQFAANVSYCTARAATDPQTYVLLGYRLVPITAVRCYYRAVLRYRACRQGLCDTSPPPLWDPPPPPNSGPPPPGPLPPRAA
jgi:RHS repeat-associated protein